MTKNFLAQWNEMQRKLVGMAKQGAAPHDEPAWSPNTDVYDGPDLLVVKVELAGVPYSNIEVSLEERALIISGVRRDPYTGETGAGYRFRQMEIEYGPFQRVIPLPYPVDGSRATAQCTGGFLEIRLPRARITEQRRITIVMQG